MHLKQLSVRREGFYGYGISDPSKPLVAVVELEGVSGSVTLNLDPDTSRQIVAVIAEQVAAAGRVTAERMTAEVINGAAMIAGAA